MLPSIQLRGMCEETAEIINHSNSRPPMKMPESPPITPGMVTIAFTTKSTLCFSDTVHINSRLDAFAKAILSHFS